MADMKKYELVFIDLDETLMDFGRAEAEALDGTLMRFGLPCTGEARALYREVNTMVWKQLEAGHIDATTLRPLRWRLFLERLAAGDAGVSGPVSPVSRNGGSADQSAATGTAVTVVTPEALSADYLERLGRGAFLLPGALDVCRHIAERCRLVLVTNGLREVQRARIGLTPLGQYLSGLVISEEVGTSKPDPAIFRPTCDALGIHDPGAMLMVGDSLSSDIRAGVNFGMDT